MNRLLARTAASSARVVSRRPLSNVMVSSNIKTTAVFSQHRTFLTSSSTSSTNSMYSSRVGAPIASSINFQKSFMSIQVIPLESLGDSITTAVLLQWNKEVGDPVHEDDVIAVVETDKVTMDIRAKKSGTFLEALCADGAEISVGADLYRIDTSVVGTPINAEATLGNAAPPAPASAAATKTRVTVNVPIMGESITTGMVSVLNFKTGDYVGLDEVVGVIETDKVNVEVRNTRAGTLVETFCAEGDEVNVGQPMFAIEDGDNASATAAPVAAPAPALAPVAKKAAAPVAPQVSSAPVVKAAAAPKAAAAAATSAAPAKPKPAASASAPVVVGERTESRVKMTRMRLRIAQRLKEAQNTAAMLTTFQEVDMGPLMDMRKLHKDEFEKTHGVKLGFMSAFVRAATSALQELPAVNAVIDDETKEIVYRNYVDISVAVASPNGLVVPVLRNTEKMSFADVEKTIGHFGNKAKAGTLALEDMAGGTFTISNGGVFGSLFGTPIINPPQSAILGMHATKMRPMVMPDGSIQARPMMYLALTYDHRLVDGREAVTFLKLIQAKIQDPTRLLLSL